MPLTQTQQAYYQGNDYGGYQFLTLQEIVDNFMATWVGADKVFGRTNRADVNFHAHRAMQELTYDTFKSCKSQEIEICPNLKMPLPQDYVNYVKLTWVDSAGIEHIIYPTSKTSNPFAIEQIQDDCTDCGDTSTTYQFGVTDSFGHTDPNILRPQDEQCDTETKICGFDVDGHFPGGSGGNHIMQAFAPTGSLYYYTSNDQLLLWKAWLYAIDNYCDCLKASGAEENCGDQIDPGWTGFIAQLASFVYNPTPGPITNILGKIQNFAGWSAFQASGTGVSSSGVVNGTLPTITTPGVPIFSNTSNAWENYKSATPIENQEYTENYWRDSDGRRYGLDPQYAQSNGSFFIDCGTGIIHFSSNLSGQTVKLKYISDGLGTDEEMIVHKFAEEAMYQSIAYGLAQTKSGIQEYLIGRLKQQKVAATRRAKIRLSNIKLEEITQIFRGKGKHIKH